MREYDRAMMRSAFVSLFWSVVSERRKRGFKLQDLAKALSKDKSTVSRWFSGQPDAQPNWTLNTVSDIANALDLDLHIEAQDRITKVTYTPSGPVHVRVNEPRDLTESRGPRLVPMYKEDPTTLTSTG